VIHRSLRFNPPDQDADAKKFRYTVESRWHIFRAVFEGDEGPAASDDVKTNMALVSALRAELGEPGRKAGPGWFGDDLSRWGLQMMAQRQEATTYVMDVTTGQLLNGEETRYITGWHYMCVLTFRDSADAQAFVETHGDRVLPKHGSAGHAASLGTTKGAT
jgi:hypothetical protein